MVIIKAMPISFKLNVTGGMLGVVRCLEIGTEGKVIVGSDSGWFTFTVSQNLCANPPL